jgi:hypothetical protein
MNWQTRGTWLHGEYPEAETEQESASIQLPDGTPQWSDSTAELQQIHEALVAMGWGRGPI